MRRKIAIFVLSSFALVLLLAGCGGGSGSIDKAAFVEQATSICQEVSGQLAAEFQAFGKKEANSSSTAATNKLVTQVLVPNLETELEEIRALGVPSESKRQVEAFFDAMRKMIKSADTNPEDFATGTGQYESAELAGRQFGLSECPISAVSPS